VNPNGLFVFHSKSNSGHQRITAWLHVTTSACGVDGHSDEHTQHSRMQGNLSQLRCSLKPQDKDRQPIDYLENLSIVG
jgi:hypothetical protein